MKLALILAGAALVHAQDIDAFWRETLARLAKVPLAVTETELREPLPYRSYSVEFASLEGARVKANLALPIRGGEKPARMPAVVTAPGYEGSQQGVMLAECQRGYAILQVWPRPVPAGTDKLTWRTASPQGAYYQFAYADVVRAIDYLSARAGIDPDRIAIAGTSQGGGIALAVASLDSRVKAVVAHVPFLCDMRAAARTRGSLVGRLLDQAGRNNEEALRTLDYFDPLNLVPRLRSPALVSSGGKDLTCPSPGIRAVFDRIPSVKSLFQDPELIHTTSAPFYDMMWSWIDRYVGRSQRE
jgi:cephalosporin-C deacetylase